MHIVYKLLRIQTLINQNINNKISSVWAQTVRIKEVNGMMRNGDAKPNQNVHADRMSSLQAAPKLFYCEEEVQAGSWSDLSLSSNFSYFLLQ